MLLALEITEGNVKLVPTCVDCGQVIVTPLQIPETQQLEINPDKHTLCANCTITRLVLLPGFIAVHAVAEFGPKRELFGEVPKQTM
jgi:hypothetical protein